MVCSFFRGLHCVIARLHRQQRRGGESPHILRKSYTDGLSHAQIVLKFLFAFFFILVMNIVF